MGVDGRPSTGWKYGANGAKNAGSSSSASTRASSSGSRSSSGGSRDSHAATGPLIVRNTVASITSSPRDRGHLPSQAAARHLPPEFFRAKEVRYLCRCCLLTVVDHRFIHDRSGRRRITVTAVSGAWGLVLSILASWRSRRATLSDSSASGAERRGEPR